MKIDEEKPVDQFKPVAFCVQGEDHTSQGNEDLLHFNHVRANIGGGWNGSSAFTPKESGYYAFSINFLRDTDGGHTWDDVLLKLKVDGTDEGYAWCGHGNIPRKHATWNAVLHVERGKRVEIFVHSGGAGAARRVRDYTFSGFRVV